MELQAFNNGYLNRLRAKEAVAQEHFTDYFGKLLTIKLRARRLPVEQVEDLRQETFARVLSALHSESGIRSAEALGAFVNTVCNNVLMEHYRRAAPARNETLDDHPDLPGKTLDLDGMLVSGETRIAVRKALAQLSPRESEIMRAIFLEEKDKSEVCRQFGVNRDYLRVVLLRAKARFRKVYSDGGAYPQMAAAKN